jgi:membrane-bound serine protease (ClpP class)
MTPTTIRKGRRAVWCALATAGFLLTFILGSRAETTPTLVTRQAPKKIPPRELPSGEKFLVYRIPLHAEIDSESSFFIHRAVPAAKAAHADAVVLDLDTPGGRVDSAMQIRDDLIELKMPSYTHVNPHAFSAGALIAVALDKIIMAPVSAIGAAQVISSTGQEIPSKVERKYTSALKGEIRSTAKYKGYPVQICEAFVDSEIDIPKLKPKGEVLTMDQEQAITVMGLTNPADPTSSRTLASYIAVDTEDIMKRESIWPVEIHEYTMSWSEKLAGYLLRIKALLLLIGLVAIYLEIKMPGLGIAGVVGAIALALFFWGSYLADLSGYLEVVLFVAGLGLLLLEIFVIPGFGVAGISGILLIFVSLVMAMIKLPPPNIPDISFNTDQLKQAIWTLVFAFGSFVPIAIILAKVLPATPLYRFLVLNPEETKAADERLRAEAPKGYGQMRELPAEQLVGKTGEAVTDLRPAGIVRVEGMPLDAMTRGEYLVKGTQVRVIDVQGSVHMVEEAGPGRSSA